MFRLLLRFLGLCWLAIAFATLIADVTRTIAGARLSVTPIGDALMVLTPAKLAFAQAAIERHVHPFIWDPVLVDLLRLAVWLTAGLAGVLTARLANKPAAKFGFSSR